MKKIISALLSLILVISVFSVIPFAASALEPLASSANLDENTYYEFDSSSGILSIYGRKAQSQPMPDYNSPTFGPVSPFYGHTEIQRVDIYDVTTVGHYAFLGCTGITSVNFNYKDKTTTIGSCAFQDCTGLNNIKFKSGLQFIYDHAFFRCTGLTKVELPAAVDVIGDNAFSGCSNLKQIDIPNPNCGLGESAFAQCTSLTEMVIPGSAGYNLISAKVFSGCTLLKKVTMRPGTTSTLVDSNAFFGCTALTDIYFAGTEEQWNAIHWSPNNEPAQNNATVHLNSAWGRCGETTEFVCNTADKVLTVSGTGHTAFYYDTTYSTEIPWYSYKDKITSVVVEEGITGVRDYVFADLSNLKSITLPQSISYFSTFATSGCDALTDVYYMGTESEWAKVFKGTLASKTVHFHEHSFGEWQITTPATCTVKGEKARSCSVCGAEETEEIPTKEHSWGAWTVTKAATCTAAGTGVHTCSVCGAEETGTIDATGHKMTFFAAKAATTSATGNKAYYECSVCGKLFADKEGKNETTLAEVTIAKLAVYTITYKLDGGKNGKNPTSYNVTTATIALKNPTKTGYTFKGWYSDAKFKTKVTQIAKGSTGNKTFYAKWSKNTYTLIYKLDGGKNGNNPKTYTVTDAITLKNPTKTGYTFKGWYSDAKFKTKVAKITKGSTGNKTLYAKWQKNTYKITYKLNGGKNGKNPKTYTVTDAITLKNPTKTGYTFKGWYSDAKFKNKVTKIAKGSTGNKTLYAKWVKKK